MIDRVPQVRAALAEARVAERNVIVDAVRAERVLGVLGEAEVGKTETIRQALAHADLDGPVLRLDLDAAASDAHIGFSLAKQLTSAVLGPVDFSLLAGNVLVPQRVTQRRVDVAERLGLEGLDEALRDWPSGRYSSTAAIAAVERLANERPVTLWIDHLEAPELTPRHPVDVGRLLWGIREILQREPGLRVVLSARSALEPDLLGPRAAFHQQGQWLTLDVPAPASWGQVATSGGLPSPLGEQLARLTAGHPSTMQLALLLAGDDPQQARRSEEVLRDLAIRDDGLTARAVQHARTLHRLGGQVLTQIARGERPYAVTQRGSASNQEIRKVLNRLRLAGLLRRRDGWALTNPLIAMRLRGRVVGAMGIEEQAADSPL